MSLSKSVTHATIYDVEKFLRTITDLQKENLDLLVQVEELQKRLEDLSKLDLIKKKSYSKAKGWFW